MSAARVAEAADFGPHRPLRALAMHPAVMAGFTLPRPLQAAGGLATAAMAATVVALAATWIR